MEGLEVSIIPYRSAIETDSAGRIDSSFFEKRFIEVRKLSTAWERLETHAKAIVCGPFGSNLLNDNYAENGIPMIRPFNLRNCRADLGDIALLEKSFVTDAKLKTFPAGTVMFARVGDIGAGVNLYECATISPNIIAAELRDSVDPYFVGVFANTRFGISQLEAGMKVVAQPTISTDSIRSLRIPPLSSEFQKKIAEIFKQAVADRDQGKHLLETTESALLHALSLDTWTPPEALSYVRSSSQAFAAGRLDAEYQHPIHTALFSHISRKFELTRLSKLGEVTKGVTVKYFDDGIIPIIRSGDLKDIESETHLLRSQPDEPIFYLQKGDILISSIGFGSIGKVQVFDKEGQFGVVSEVTVIRQNALNPYYIAAFLRSTAGQMQIERHITGATGQLHLYPRDVANFWIPVLPVAEQKHYELLTKQSHALKARANCLLDAAKRAVEIAIEDSEAAALAYLAQAST